MSEQQAALRGRKPSTVVGLVPCVAVLAGLAAPVAAQSPERPALDLTVERLVADVWLHSSDGVGPRANGLIVATDEGSLLVNTAPTVAGTRALLAWAEHELPQPVRLAILTGAGPARMGGIAALIEAEIPVHASERTAARARRSGLGWTRDHFGFESEARIRAGQYTLELFFPEAGDAPDDLLVWIPEARVLFGGALVRDAGAEALEPASPARLNRWSQAVRRTRELSRGVRWVVPGEGDAGDAALLDHTLALLQAARR
jgi:glyoxylase-like metal-dependent hydrolase (beta-lactamase superfamily II)